MPTSGRHEVAGRRLHLERLKSDRNSGLGCENGFRCLTRFAIDRPGDPKDHPARPNLAEVREPIVRSTLGAINANDSPIVVDSDLPRKEVIQPHLPVRLPCYDFVPITDPTFDGCLLAVGPPASGVASFHDVTGGVYKAREHIHRRNADRRLLATPASCRRVAAYNPN